MELNLAVLIDFENIAAGAEKDGMGRFDVEVVLKRIMDKGRVLIARSYADWGRFARFKQTLLTNNVTMMELTSHGMQDKNRADIALVVDALELAFTKDYIDAYVIVSGDSDFTPLVLKMRELNKRVIGVGCRSSTSRLLIQACDEFIFYDNLVKRKRRSKPAPSRKDPINSKVGGAFDLLVDALEGLQRETPEAPLAGVVKSAMLRKSPDFSENDLGFSSFTRFLEKAHQANHITLSKDNKSGGFRVDSTSGESSNRPPAPQDGGGRGGADDADWHDPYLPEGSEGHVDVLTAMGMNPLAAPTRKAILQVLEECVEQRAKKRRRTTVQFVQEDVRRRLRKTHPDLPSRAIRHVFNALMRAGVFIHRDGSPVRTGSAPFHLDKSAEELNATICDIYIDELHRSGKDMNVTLLADLFYGDPSATRPVEMAVAYLQAHAQDDGAGDDDSEEPLNEAMMGDDINLDDLLLEDDDGDNQADNVEPSIDDDVILELVEEDAEPEQSAAPEQATEEPTEDKPKRKRARRRRKKEPKAEVEASAEAEPEASPAQESAGATRKRVVQGDDLDALLSMD